MLHTSRPFNDISDVRDLRYSLCHQFSVRFLSRNQKSEPLKTRLWEFHVLLLGLGSLIAQSAIWFNNRNSACTEVLEIIVFVQNIQAKGLPELSSRILFHHRSQPWSCQTAIYCLHKKLLSQYFAAGLFVSYSVAARYCIMSHMTLSVYRREWRWWGLQTEHV